MVRIEFELADAELARLRELATAKGCSVNDALRAFARACQPGGGEWVHPAVAAARYRAKRKPYTAPRLRVLGKR